MACLKKKIQEIRAGRTAQQLTHLLCKQDDKFRCGSTAPIQYLNAEVEELLLL